MTIARLDPRDRGWDAPPVKVAIGADDVVGTLLLDGPLVTTADDADPAGLLFDARLLVLVGCIVGVLSALRVTGLDEAITGISVVRKVDASVEAATEAVSVIPGYGPVLKFPFRPSGRA